MPFAALVIGPPGSGKSTLCRGLSELLEGVGRRHRIVNLDPAAEALPYAPTDDVRSWLDLRTLMGRTGLGPNGGLLRAAEHLAAHPTWLVDLVRSDPDVFWLLDAPGQAELFACSGAFDSLARSLEAAGVRLAALHLVDAVQVATPAGFVAAVAVSLSSMLTLALPHINAVTKADLALQTGAGLDLPSVAADADADSIADALPPRQASLARRLLEAAADHALVHFHVLAVEDRTSMLYVLQALDRALGYAPGMAGDTSFDAAALLQDDPPDERVQDLLDRLHIIPSSDEEDEE